MACEDEMARGVKHDGLKNDGRGQLSYWSRNRDKPVFVSKYGEAVVGNVRLVLQQPLEMAAEQTEASMKSLADRVKKAGGMIGHIRGTAKEAGKMYRLSVAEDGRAERIYTDNTSEIMVECVFIVFGPEESELQGWLEQEFRCERQQALQRMEGDFREEF